MSNFDVNQGGQGLKSKELIWKPHSIANSGDLSNVASTSTVIHLAQAPKILAPNSPAEIASSPDAIDMEGEMVGFSRHQQATPRDKVLQRPIPVHVAQKQLPLDTSHVTTPSATPIQATSSTLATHVRRTRTANKAERERLKAEKARKTTEDRVRRQEEAKEKLMTPLEYATKLLTKFQAVLERTPAEKLFLKAKYIFYIGGDLKLASGSTRDKMDFVRASFLCFVKPLSVATLSQIRKKGGVVCPSFDPSVVTHIVTDAKTTSTLKALGLKSLSDIPDHIPTVTWSWITSGNNGRLGYEFMHAAFASRIDADSSRAPMQGKGKGKEVAPQFAANEIAVDPEFSRIECARLPSTMRC